MNREDRRQLEDRLRTLYAVPEAEVPQALLSELRSASTPVRRRGSAAAFAASQVRFVHPRTWGLIVAGAILACLTCNHSTLSTLTYLAQSGLGVSLALAVLLELVSARSSGMDELEGSCVYNAHAVACARLVIAGSAGSLALAAAVVFSAGSEPVWALLAHAALPYFAAAAGGLMVARRSAAPNALVAVLVWSAFVCAAYLVTASAFPGAYAAASSGAWALATLAAAAWCAREVARWLRLSAVPAEPAVTPAAA